MSDIEKVPFFEKSHSIREESWGGAENKVSSIAFNVPENTKPESIEYTHVLKEPQGINYFNKLGEKYPPQNEKEEAALKSLSEYFNSTKHFANSQKDYKAMKAIFGDLLLDTDYIIGEPRDGNPCGLYIVQDMVVGETWTKYSKHRTSSENEEFMARHHEQLVNLIGGSRKVLIEAGATVDIWGDNIMVDEKLDLVLIDPGSPSELERNFDLLIQLPVGIRVLLANNLTDRLKALEDYPSIIRMTAEEIKEMNAKFGFTDAQYTQAKEKLAERCAKLLQ